MPQHKRKGRNCLSAASGQTGADVVHQSSRFSLILRTEGAGKCLAKVGSALQMLINSLLPMIFGSVSRIGDSFRAITPCFFSCVGCYVQYSR